MGMIRLNFDGLCEPVNPGGWMAWAFDALSSIGMKQDSGIVQPDRPNTNNVAEYMGLGFGLRAVHELVKSGTWPCSELVIVGDSKLVINQITGEWQCKKEHLRALRDRCRTILEEMGVKWRAEWVPRDLNEVADTLTRDRYREATGEDPPEHRRTRREEAGDGA